MLKTALPASAKNGVRKLFQENRQSFIESLMHRFVLVPEGRTDANGSDCSVYAQRAKISVSMRTHCRSGRYLALRQLTTDACWIQSKESRTYGLAPWRWLTVTPLAMITRKLC